MDGVQATLGEALLLLMSLAVVLFAVIVLLLEAKVILRLGGQLNRELRFVAPSADWSPTSRDQSAPDVDVEESHGDAAV
jgi:hypothetical protein